MLRKLYISSALLFMALILFLLFYPRKIEHAILIENNKSTTSFYINGKYKEFNCNNLNFEKNTVLDFKYNIFKAYSFSKVPFIDERIMIKGETSYDLEKQGSIDLSKDTFYYQLDKENNLVPSTSSKLIVGKNNIKSFADKNNKLKTFILAPMDYSSMRVAISTNAFSSLYHEKLDIKVPTAVELYSLMENYSTTLPANSNILIQSIGNEVHVTTKDWSRIFNHRVYLKGNNMYINSILRGSPSFNPEYNGVIEFTPSSKGILTINEVNLEDYLSKVVPSEMPASSALEALKCQAIAARTYAISDMLNNRYATQGFHVDDSTQSQVYNNMLPQESSTVAVNLTKGLIMSYNNEPIDAKYYSSSAGTGVRYEDIWFKSDFSSDYRPYLTTANYLTPETKLPTNEEEWLNFYKDKSLKAIDSISPYFRWHIEFPKTAINQSLNRSLKIIFEKYKDFMTIRKNSKKINEFPELGNLKDMIILKRSAGGNVVQISFIFENAEVDLSGDYYIRSALRCSQEFNGIPISIIRHKGSPLTSANFLPSSFFSVEKVEDKFVIYGGGYGHGAGMSQYGAMELGKAGMKYINILNTYYKDITLEKLY
jgi:stage II sporulation protein D